MLKLLILVAALLCFNYSEAYNKQIQANAACVGLSVIKEARGYIKAIPRYCSRDSMQSCNDVCKAARTVPVGYGADSKFSNLFHILLKKKAFDKEDFLFICLVFTKNFIV